MHHVNKILDFAELVYNESEKQIELHEKWIAFITPLFFQHWGLKYRYDLENLYPIHAKNFIKQQRKIFDTKNK